MDWSIIVAALIAAAAGGGLTYLYNARRVNAQNRVDCASAEKTLGEAWANMYAHLERRLNMLEQVVKDRDALIDDLQFWADELVGQLREADIAPKPFKRRRHD